MFSNILVAVDADDPAESAEALATAATLANCFTSKLTICRSESMRKPKRWNDGSQLHKLRPDDIDIDSIAGESESPLARSRPNESQRGGVKDQPCRWGNRLSE